MTTQKLPKEDKSVIYGLLLTWVSSCSAVHTDCGQCEDEEKCVEIFDKILNYIEEKQFKL